MVSVKAIVVLEINGNVQRAPINDYFNDIMSTEAMKIQKGFYIIKSNIGWMINGRTKTKEENKNENVIVIMTLSTSNILPEINKFTIVERSQQPAPDTDNFWKLQTIGIIPPKKTKNDDRVMKYSNNTVIKENGRYQLVWPWRKEDINLPENFELSYRRLKSLHKRTVEVTDVLCKYGNIIKEQHKKI